MQKSFKVFKILYFQWSKFQVVVSSCSKLQVVVPSGKNSKWNSNLAPPVVYNNFLSSLLLQENQMKVFISIDPNWPISSIRKIYSVHVTTGFLLLPIWIVILCTLVLFRNQKESSIRGTKSWRTLQTNHRYAIIFPQSVHIY